jgi:hypothetical protein
MNPIAFSSEVDTGSREENASKTRIQGFGSPKPYTRSGRDIQLTIGIAGSTHPIPATT